MIDEYVCSYLNVINEDIEANFIESDWAVTLQK
jgi:hypothetical protein